MQNINLYQRQQKRSHGPRPKQMVLGWLLLFAVIISHAAWQAWQLQQATTLANATQSRAQALQAEFSAATASFQAPQLDPLLPEQLAQQEQSNLQLQRLVAHLQLLSQQQSAGFVAPLAALSERHPPAGLWLSEIALRDGGSNLTLQGFSQDQQLLPLYLQSLGVSPVFRGRAFAHFELQRNADGLLGFRLSSRLDDEGKSHE
ncbi:MAG: PilN domain-containing protein [Pseudomonadaceae bacterium]|nr:PilN domain-containing protein [Pseudomonadaceae bacterium]